MNEITPKERIAALIADAERVEPNLSEETLPPQSTLEAAQKQNARKVRPNADTLAEIALATTIFRTSDGREFADVVENGQRRTLGIRSRAFEKYLYDTCKALTGFAPKQDAIDAAVRIACSEAHYGATQYEVHVRVGGYNGCIYLDNIAMGDSTFQTIEVDSNGWRVVKNPPIRFIRPKGMKPLPKPEPNGDISLLWSLLNLQTKAQQIMYTSFLLSALRPRPPYPICVITGEQGSTKTTTAKIARLLLDPCAAPLRALPQNERDLCIAAQNAHVLGFDNISQLRGWLPDAFCRMATGAGFSTRGLYTNDEEVIFESARPIILNGIANFVTQSDLADRCFFIQLSPLLPGQRRTEDELWSEFKSLHPKILGALLDAVAMGLRRLDETGKINLPRMADAAKWILACETAFWEPGTFLRVYEENRAEAIETAIEASAVACAILELMHDRAEWVGTTNGLLQELNRLPGYGIWIPGWPKNWDELKNRLKEIHFLLRKKGLEIQRPPRTGKRGDRILRIIRRG